MKNNLPLLLGKRYCGRALHWSLALLPCVLQAPAADHVVLWTESAPAANGPWTQSVPSEINRDGSLVHPADATHEFWRLRISRTANLSFTPALSLSEIPPETVQIAREFLQLQAAPDTDEGEGSFEAEWFRARLADTVIPVYDGAGRPADGPAYLEFKVIRDSASAGGGRTDFRETASAARPDLGFILVSLTENDFPVAMWSPSGETRVEKLRRLAGTSLVKPVTFTPALMVVESPDGKMLSSHGSLLSRPSPGLLLHAKEIGVSMGDSETGVSNRTPDLELTAFLEPYATYADMKADFATNEYYLQLREQTRRNARVEWMLQRGTPPPQLRVAMGQTLSFLGGKNVLDAKVEPAEDEARIAQVTPQGRMGLQVMGLAAGAAPLLVETDEGEEVYLLIVDSNEAAGGAGGGIWGPGWKTHLIYSAGKWTDQRKYDQFQSLLFGGGGAGNFVGCGPTAWAILLGWWDLKGVPAIFKPYIYGSGLPNHKLGLPDAPLENDGAVQKLMKDFRSQWVDPLYCDVVTGQCGTPPEKMASGIDYFIHLSYVYNLVYGLLLQNQAMGYGYQMQWAWVPYNGINEFNLLGRSSIRDGYPAILGIGHLKHYLVAYAYKTERFELAPGLFVAWRAWFKTNWGDGGDPIYYGFKDNFFFASKMRFWQSVTEYNL